jgi:hypothetical protein
MPPVVSALLAFVVALCRARASLHLEHLARRHQLAVSQQTVQHPRVRPRDRWFWTCLSRLWAGGQQALPLALSTLRACVEHHVGALR